MNGNTTSKAYKLNFDIENYRGVGPVSPTELDSDRLWLTGESKAKNWSAPELMFSIPESQNDSIADISWFGPGFYTFSEKAVDTLQHQLKAHGELLPAEVEGHRLMAFNPLNSIDCLDQASSKYNIRRNGKIGRLLKPSIDTNKTNGAALFQTPETYRNTLFASEAFKQAYDEAGLTGLLFEDCTKP